MTAISQYLNLTPRSEAEEDYARLFAAAPDLLAALERSEQYLRVAIMDQEERGEAGASLATIARNDLDIIIAAIAKARG